MLKVTEDDVFEIRQLPVEVEEFFEHFMRVGGELLTVLLRGETISKDTISLTNVQLDEVLFVCNILKRAHEHTLNDFTKITQVESIMALSRRGQEVIDDILVDRDSGLDDEISKGSKGAILLKREVSLQDLREDLLHGLRGKVGYPKHVEVAE